MDREELAHRVALAYETYRVKVESLRAQAERDAEASEAFRGLREMMHQAHRKGLPKREIRKAVRAHGDNNRFTYLWGDDE